MPSISSSARTSLPLMLFLLALALAALFAWRTPRWQAPDEPAHYAYVQHVARSGQPPVLVARCYDEAYKAELTGNNFAEEPELSRFCYEGHQPPLFYYLAAPVYLLSRGSLLALRLFCALLGAGVVLAAWGIVRAAGGDGWLAGAVAALVALLPQHLAMIGTLNNDALSYLVVALAAWQMVRLLRREVLAPPGEWALLGLLLGLALITKTLAWVTLPMAGLTLLLADSKAQRGRVLLARGLLLFGIAALFILPWFARNLVTYGGLDLMGLVRHDEIAVGQPRTAEEIAMRGLGGTIANGLRVTFHSFWGQFGWMKAPLQPREYLILALFSLVALLGLLFWLARRGWRRWGLDGRALLLFALWWLVNGGLLLYYNLEFVQYQGRYLFTALVPFALFFMVGLGGWLPPRLRLLPWGALLLFLLYLDALAILERLPGMMHY